jgi:hypothetical protein
MYASARIIRTLKLILFHGHILWRERTSRSNRIHGESSYVTAILTVGKKVSHEQLHVRQSHRSSSMPALELSASGAQVATDPLAIAIFACTQLPLGFCKVNKVLATEKPLPPVPPFEINRTHHWDTFTEIGGIIFLSNKFQDLVDWLKIGDCSSEIQLSQNGWKIACCQKRLTGAKKDEPG